MSVAIKEIDCLPTFQFVRSAISRVVAMNITSILKNAVEYLRQTAFMP